MNPVFPQEIINLSVESHFVKFSKKTILLYVVVLLFFVVAFISLFFIKLDITIQSRGMLRSSKEPVSVTTGVAAEVTHCFINENQFVNSGDTLLCLDFQKLEERNKYYKSLIDQNNVYLTDIENILKYKYDIIKSDLYTSIHSKYRQKLKEFDININILQKTFNRTSLLHSKDVIPIAELEEKEFDLNKMVEAKNIFVQINRSDWQKQAVDYQLENKKYENILDEIDRDFQFYFIKAPETGYIRNYNGLKAHSYVSSGQTVALISPVDQIIAEHLVSPKDIGFLKKGMEVIHQVDAYNYNQWGVVSGIVTELSNDIYIVGEQPYFKVRSKLNEKFLSLKNGYRGDLKNGLTTTARYKVTKRTIAQLLFDKTDNWLNPAIITD